MARESSQGITPAQFVAKWSRVQLPERAASQEHFIDLCRLLGQPTPAEHDATGAEYTFEKGVAVTGGASRGAKGDSGYADVWWRGKFGWEYKRKGKYRDLSDAYRQLCQYREALDNPPLLIVSDIARTEIHTNFTGTAKQVYSIALADLAAPENLDLLRRAFTAPETFKPEITPEKVTQDVAAHVAALASALQARGHNAHKTAHFLMKCMFCLFAEDVELLPDKLFSRLLRQWHDQPDQLTAVLTDLFAKMRTGGPFGYERIAWFNGGLFDEAPALPLTYDEIGLLRIASAQDWGSVEPAIFGTLFERSLDPEKRAQIGAHYTSREDILLIVAPVVMAPLRKQWADVQAQVDAALQRRRSVTTAAAKRKADADIENALAGFVHALGGIRILDPACGSGNFLYVAIQQILNLEKEVITYAARPEIGQTLFPTVRPTQLHGLEINPYAAELAQVVIWIGYLQWMRDNGFNAPHDPILETLATIENRDAILDRTDPNLPTPAKWPQADYIIGNPPFLGGNLIRQGLGDEYVEALFKAYEIPNYSDLCCYWFERARQMIEKAKAAGDTGPRAGLLATQGIRGGANRRTIERVKRTGGIFLGWSDRPWILEGAAVRVSMIGFDDGSEQHHVLNGRPVPAIHSNLSDGDDLTLAVKLTENLCIQHEADKKGASFDISHGEARRILSSPTVSGKKMLDVCRPWANGQDITGRGRSMWIIDFGTQMAMDEAASYEAAFEHVKNEVGVKYAQLRRRWWLHERPRPDMRSALAPLVRYLGTPMLTKHRLFVWLDHDVLPDHQLVVFARADDYFFGVLHSSIHELWARRMGTQLREAESGFRYTPTTCFETFPLPWAPGSEPVGEGLHEAISAAARELDEMRQRWLNPPEWIEPVAQEIDARDDFADVPDTVAQPPSAGSAAGAQPGAAVPQDSPGGMVTPPLRDHVAIAVSGKNPQPGAAVPHSPRALIRQSAIMALAAKDAKLKKRTLTNLYNERPTWLKLAHRKLDEAVLAAYAATDAPGQWSPAWAEAWADTGAGQPLPPEHPLTARRAEVDQMVLANLLRLNLARSGA